MSNIFETASRKAYRFPSVRGQLTTEQLWDLPLTSATNPSLDAVAKSVNAELKNVTTESFVSVETNPAKGALETKLEIVKRIIAVRLAENEASRNAVAKKAEKEKLLDVLSRKQDASLESLSEDEIRARVAAL